MDTAWIDVVEAWEIIERETRVLSTEHVGLEDAVGRVLAQEVCSDRDSPPFDRSAMDGYAVQSSEVATASPQAPTRLRIIGESTPGNAYTGEGLPGTAVRIMTGAPVPADWDCVVPVEQTSGFKSVAEFVEVQASARAGQNIAPRAVERRAGEILYEAGHCINPTDIGVLAMVGASQLRVVRRPTVAILSTGNELVSYRNQPAPTQIRDSNAPMLRALARPHAAQLLEFQPAADRRSEIDALTRKALRADALLMTGGVSMGAYDLVGAALREAGIRLHFERVALQPGKPVTFGTHDGGIVLALPGNPVSALTTFRLFALPALSRLQGQRTVRPSWSQLPARFEWRRRNRKWIVLPGKLARSPWGVELVAYSGSGDLMAYSNADCQVVFPPTIEGVQPGDPVAVWPI